VAAPGTADTDCLLPQYSVLAHIVEHTDTRPSLLSEICVWLSVCLSVPPNCEDDLPTNFHQRHLVVKKLTIIFSENDFNYDQEIVVPSICYFLQQSQ
jgi:hypothetical protein